MRELTLVVVIGSMLLVPSTSHGYPAGVATPVRAADLSDSSSLDSPRLRPSFWRGRPPVICPTGRCPDMSPTFCLVEEPHRLGPRSWRQDECPKRLRVGDADIPSLRRRLDPRP